MREKVDYMHIILRGGLLAMVCALLSVVWVNDPMLPAGELSGQWLYLAKVAMGAAVERGMIWGLIFIRSLFGVLLFWLLLRLFMV